MSERNDESLRKMLRAAMPPLDKAELEGDLWPRMLRRLEDRPMQASWLDWALVAAAMVWFFIFPEVIPALLYQL